MDPGAGGPSALPLAEGEVLDEGGAPDEGGEEVVVVWYHQLRRKRK